MTWARDPWIYCHDCGQCHPCDCRPDRHLRLRALECVTLADGRRILRARSEPDLSTASDRTPAAESITNHAERMARD